MASEHALHQRKTSGAWFDGIDVGGRRWNKNRLARNRRIDDRKLVLEAISCNHSRMTECHPGCGHYSCPCGVSWDEGAGR